MAEKKVLVSTLTSVYKSETYLELFLLNFLNQTIANHTELILNVSNPSKTEISLIKKYRPEIKHLKVKVNRNRISIYRSWNQSLSLATGRYIAVWNVDDLRTRNSLESQISIITQGKHVGCSGPFTVVRKFGEFEGQALNNVNAPHYENYRSMLLGPFFMFDSRTLESLKGFDEQFKVASDFDFAVRLSSVGTIGYTTNNLGAYLNSRSGASTSRNSIQPIERDSIYLRYRALDKVDVSLLPSSLDFDLDHAIIQNRKYKLHEVVPGLEMIRIVNLGHWKGIRFTTHQSIGTTLNRFTADIKGRIRFGISKLTKSFL